MKQYGLIGYPLGHSFSRKYFSDKFAAENIKDVSYNLFPLESITMLPGLLKDHPAIMGLNVTIPYKKDVLPYLTNTIHLEGLDACNCIRIKGDDLIGYNTDVTGFSESIRPLLQVQHTHALILGNGGATAAVRFALDRLGLKYAVVSRTKSIGVDFLYEELDVQIMSDYTVIINTTPLGTSPEIQLSAPIPYRFINQKHLLYDLVYNPSVTSFMRKGLERGAVVKNGYDMLVIQAEESWKIWSK